MCSRPKSLSGSSSESKSTATGLDDLPSSPSHRYSRSWRKRRRADVVPHTLCYCLCAVERMTPSARLPPAPAGTGEAALPACRAAAGWGGTRRVRSRACGPTAGTTGRSQTGRYLGNRGEKGGGHVAAARACDRSAGKSSSGMAFSVTAQNSGSRADTCRNHGALFFVWRPFSPFYSQLMQQHEQEKKKKCFF